jgi:hypothetical protein
MTAWQNMNLTANSKEVKVRNTIKYAKVLE